MAYVLTDEHIEELREKAKYAVHNGGTVNVNCFALLALLPEPKKPEPPSPFVEAALIPDTTAPVLGSAPDSPTPTLEPQTPANVNEPVQIVEAADAKPLTPETAAASEAPAKPEDQPADAATEEKPEDKKTTIQ